MTRIFVAYSHAAPFIRQEIVEAATQSLKGTTQRARYEGLNKARGLAQALSILADSHDGAAVAQVAGLPSGVAYDPDVEDHLGVILGEDYDRLFPPEVRESLSSDPEGQHDR